MNFYMLVEGKLTEKLVYPKLLKHYKPEYERVFHLPDIKNNNYYIQSGFGVPNFYDKILPSIEDINEHNLKCTQKIDCFVACLDADFLGSVEDTNDRLERELLKAAQQGASLGIKDVFIIQNKCIETWFLGNSLAFPMENYTDKFKPYARHYNVSTNDPEYMDSADSRSIGNYTKDYLRSMLNESEKSYSVSNVSAVTQPEYIKEMDKRCKVTGHINSFNSFLQFLKLL